MVVPGSGRVMSVRARLFEAGTPLGISEVLAPMVAGIVGPLVLIVLGRRLLGERSRLILGA